MKTWRHLILYFVCLPVDLLSWTVILFMRAAWGERLEWETPKAIGRPGGPVLSVDLSEGSWPVSPGTWPKGWYLKRESKKEPSHPRTWGGTTLGHAIFYGPGRRAPLGLPWAPVQVHEHVHVEQFEAAMLRSFLVGLAVAVLAHLWGQSTAFWILGGVIWFLGYPLMGAANWTTALLRGEDAYRGSHHEEAAYAIDDLYEQEMARKEQES